ncbi:RNA-binding protein [Falsibacillus pallidus]|uniref:RNA-binding protein YlmH n=1 Tax=Falsibacillus pallidus TaxID=493781 RepID=A0A370H0F5_9BACI|nr:RNA-binding protein [Falsibacillus pallidus]RDI47533.1 RNA-binding protein YlmH [Falsibacillus pallidus]
MTDIYQHFRSEEKDFVDSVIQWRQYTETTYAPKLTDFLDPRQQWIVQSIIGKEGEIKCSFFGGYEQAERKRALIYPSYYAPSEEDFLITVAEINYPHKFVSIDHRKILGSLMSIGLKREKFGDIIVSGERVQFLSVKEMDDFVRMEFTHVGKTPVAVEEKPIDDLLHNPENWKESSTTVSSLRLDAVLGAIMNISRQKSQLLIQSGHVKVNWKISEQTSFLCEEGDMISARGFGRAKIVSIEGKTKKEKWRIVVGVLK